MSLIASYFISMLVFEASETPSQRGTLGTGQTVGGAKWTGVTDWAAFLLDEVTLTQYGTWRD